MIPARRMVLVRGASCVLLGFSLLLSIDGVALTGLPSGIQPLETLPPAQPLFAGASIRALLTPTEQEWFLRELDKRPPEWEQLHDRAGEELGARLFDFNRQRDAAREGHPLLNQRVAFWWSGVLGDYGEAHRGFTVVMGPEFTQTTWGLVRFKPQGLPHELVAVPSADRLRTLRQRRTRGEPVEIGILFTGTLIPWESIIYAFSHDGDEQGLIMPVVQIDEVRYFLHHISNQ